MRFKIKATASICVLITFIEIINLLTGRSLSGFGIIPRTFDGLFGIFTAPMIHASIGHYLSNIFPLAVLVFLLLNHGFKCFCYVFFGVALLGGISVWAFGRVASHIGSSGLIFGLFGYLVVSGLISKEVKLIAISFAVAIMYSGLLWGVLPLNRYISFESHFFSLIAGVVLAYLLRTRA